MPTESAFFFAGLLFIAAALGYVFARLGRDGPAGDETTRADILRGFRYLLNEDSERAVDVFTGLDTVGDEDLETQIQLGVLFRKRGEADRAIRLHRHLLDLESLDAAQRERVMFALAEDYLAAGIHDRAEEYLLGLRRGDGALRGAALHRLLHVCEVTRDWGRAIQLCAELEGHDGYDKVEPARLVHYLCEMAEQTRAHGDAAMAAEWLARARATAPGHPRVLLLAADLARDRGDHGAALADYRELAGADPLLVGEVLSRLLDSARRALGNAGATALISEIGSADPAAQRQIALAAVRRNAPDDPAVDGAFTALLAAHPVARELLPVQGAAPASPASPLDPIRRAFVRLVGQMPGYACRICGYQSTTLQWQCPGCRHWDSVRPSSRLTPGDPP